MYIVPKISKVCSSGSIDIKQGKTNYKSYNPPPKMFPSPITQLPRATVKL